jgi:predicted secreted protein
MAEPLSFNGSKILVKVGDGGGPETFSHPCLINASRGIQFSAASIDSVIPDCADQDAPAWVTREKDSITATITGEGIMDAADTDDYFDWLTQAAAKNVQCVVNDGGATNEQTFQGAFHLTEFSISGERKEKAQVSITLVSTGAITRTAGS